MLELSAQGFQCAQIIMIIALESEGKENTDMIRAVGGLNMGFYDFSGPCGSLTGACCLISYFAGKGEKDELADVALSEMLAEFSAWFKNSYGGQICIDILDGDTNNMMSRCPDIVQNSYSKAMEILNKYGALYD